MYVLSPVYVILKYLTIYVAINGVTYCIGADFCGMHILQIVNLILICDIISRMDQSILYSR